MTRKIIDFISFKVISPFNWARIRFLLKGREYDITSADREKARDLMSKGFYIWVSRRQTHLTTYLIGFADFVLSFMYWVKSKFKGPRPKFGYWSHAFINTSHNELVEAVAKGVQEVYFDEVFDADSIACLVPAHMPLQMWHEVSKEVIQKAEEQKGKKYDSIFNILDESQVSCIELVRVSLKDKNWYKEYFTEFETVIQQYKNVTPDMLYNSKSFKVLWEVRR